MGIRGQFSAPYSRPKVMIDSYEHGDTCDLLDVIEARNPSR